MIHVNKDDSVIRSPAAQTRSKNLLAVTRQRDDRNPANISWFGGEQRCDIDLYNHHRCATTSDMYDRRKEEKLLLFCCIHLRDRIIFGCVSFYLICLFQFYLYIFF